MGAPGAGGPSVPLMDAPAGAAERLQAVLAEFAGVQAQAADQFKDPAQVTGGGGRGEVEACMARCSSYAPPSSLVTHKHSHPASFGTCAPPTPFTPLTPPPFPPIFNLSPANQPSTFPPMQAFLAGLACGMLISEGSPPHPRSRPVSADSAPARMAILLLLVFAACAALLGCLAVVACAAVAWKLTAPSEAAYFYT